MMVFIELLILLVVANGAPVLLRYLRGAHGLPLDGGLTLGDGQHILGASKTWAGLLVALISTAAVSALLGMGWLFGLLFGAVAMVGDLLSSFIKRRLGFDPSARARWLDQLPEALLPVFLAMGMRDVGWIPALSAAAAFTLLNVWGSPLLYRLGIRHRPH